LENLKVMLTLSIQSKKTVVMENARNLDQFLNCIHTAEGKRPLGKLRVHVRKLPEQIMNKLGRSVRNLLTS
jgi:hypothetical protein